MDRMRMHLRRLVSFHRSQSVVLITRHFPKPFEGKPAVSRSDTRTANAAFGVCQLSVASCPLSSSRIAAASTRAMVIAGPTTDHGPRTTDKEQMADFLQGFLGTYQSGVEARNDVTVAIRNWFANRNPLVTRLPYVPVERVDFLMYTHKYRARSTTLGAAVTADIADRDHDRRRDVLDEPRRASVRRLGDRKHGVRADQRRPDQLDHVQRDSRRRPARRRWRASPTARPST